jgi:hypothetical protein
MEITGKHWTVSVLIHVTDAFRSNLFLKELWGIRCAFAFRFLHKIAND